MRRGIVSPPRSQASPKPTRHIPDRTVTFPPTKSKSNYMSSPLQRLSTATEVQRSSKRDIKPASAASKINNNTTAQSPPEKVARSSIAARLDPSKSISNTSRLDPPTKSSMVIPLRRPIRTTAPNLNSKVKKSEGVKISTSTTPSSSSPRGSIIPSPKSNNGKGPAPQNLFPSPNRDNLRQTSTDGKGKDVARMVHQAKEEVSPPESNGSKIYKIYKKISSHRQGNSSVISYFSKLRSLWDELATYTDSPEREKVMQFLNGLNESYSTICAQLLIMSPFPTLVTACSAIIQEEKHREEFGNNNDHNGIVEEIGNDNKKNNDNGIIEEVVGNDLNQQQNDDELTSYPIIERLLDVGYPVHLLDDEISGSI